MSRTTKKVARANLFAMMTAMWSEINNKGADPYTINLTKYASKYHVGKMKRELILPYLMQPSCPTYEQACKFRKEFSDYTNKTCKKQRAVEQQLFNEKGLTIAEAIEVLKGHGYVVLKSV